MNKKLLIIFIIVIIAIFAILYFVNQNDTKDGSPNFVTTTTINTDDVKGKEILTDYLKGQYGDDAEIEFEFVSIEWIKGYVNDLVFYAKYFSDGWQTIYEGEIKDIPCEEFKKYNMPYSIIDMCYTK